MNGDRLALDPGAAAQGFAQSLGERAAGRGVERAEPLDEGHGLAATALAGVAHAEGPWLGQEPPGTEPVIFAPGLVSTGHNTQTVTYSDGQLDVNVGYTMDASLVEPYDS